MLSKLIHFQSNLNFSNNLKFQSHLLAELFIASLLIYLNAFAYSYTFEVEEKIICLSEVEQSGGERAQCRVLLGLLGPV